MNMAVLFASVMRRLACKWPPTKRQIAVAVADQTEAFSRDELSRTRDAVIEIADKVLERAGRMHRNA